MALVECVHGAVPARTREADRRFFFTYKTPRAWRDGKTSATVDYLHVYELTQSVDGTTIQGIVLASFVRSSSGAQLPFDILNALGVLDTKSAVEGHVRRATADGAFYHSVVRTGRLVSDSLKNVGMLCVEANKEWL